MNDETNDQSLTAESLSAAFARLLRSSDEPAPGTDLPASVSDASPITGRSREQTADACEISPLSLLEAMLFVGDPENRPLSSQRLAAVLRGVEPAEINGLVGQLNSRYTARRAPYRVTGEAEGYRMTLTGEFDKVRQRFNGRIRQARLSQAAIDILALVAYREPLEAGEISALRGKPCGAVLSQLVRRQLLRVERPDGQPRKALYRTTRRFLELFGLSSLEDLPRNQELSSS